MRVGSPSARRREHIRGRWLYDVDLQQGKERSIHSAKELIGFLIPWLMIALPIFLASSRAATEIASWGLAVLTLLYVGADAFAKNREFKFFRLGPDLSLAACLLFGLLSVFSSALFTGESSFDPANSFEILFEGLGQLRWIPLLYLFVYAWELFPGLNRMVLTLVGTAALISLVVWVQHFQGVDWITGETLARAPTGAIEFYMPIGFSGSTEALATLFACVLPFPVAAACLRRDHDETDRTTWLGFGVSVLIALALFFTYRTGLWWAGAAGVLTLLLFPGDRRFKLLMSVLASIAITWSLLFAAFAPLGAANSESGQETATQNPLEALVTSIEKDEAIREVSHRQQMNDLVKIWEESPILGVGASKGATRYEAVNIYFLILSRVGLLGLVGYLIFILHHLLNTLRLFHEIPESHHRHRILVAGCFASQCAFHVAGLFWGTMTEAFSMNLFVLVSSITLYMNEHYTHGLVPDDNAL